MAEYVRRWLCRKPRWLSDCGEVSDLSREFAERNLTLLGTGSRTGSGLRSGQRYKWHPDGQGIESRIVETGRTPLVGCGCQQPSMRSGRAEGRTPAHSRPAVEFGRARRKSTAGTEARSMPGIAARLHRKRGEARCGAHVRIHHEIPNDAAGRLLVAQNRMNASCNQSRRRLACQVQLFRNARRSAFTVSCSVAVRPCGAPG